MDAQLSLKPSPSEMRRALAAHDATYDRIFFVAAADRGVFCRPSCPEPRQRQGDLDCFGSVKEALFAGYRPCPTCRPLAVPGEPAWVETLIARVAETREDRLRDTDLVDLGVDPERARRWFQEHFGMTFHAFARGRRLSASLERVRRGTEERVRRATDERESALDGFGEIFAEAFERSTRPERAGERLPAAWMATPLGPLVAASTERGVCLLEFTDRRQLEVQIQTVRRRLGATLVAGTHPHLDRLRGELEEYFAGERREFNLELDVPGSAFQSRVWMALRRIPYGATVSYEALAESLGSPGAQRAVGTANGQNPVAIVVPCHRVVKKDGQAGGYGGGTWRKQWLLALERGLRPSSPKAP